jgi:hypothetical protein
MECWIKVTQYFNMHLSMDDYRNLKLIFASHEGLALLVVAVVAEACYHHISCCLKHGSYVQAKSRSSGV